MKNIILVLLLVIIVSKNGHSQELSMFPSFFTYQYYEDSNKITKSQFESLIKTDKKAFQHWKKSKQHNVLYIVTASAGIASSALSAIQTDNQPSRNLFQVGAISSLAAAIWFSYSRRTLQKNAILSYNENLISTSIQFGPTNSGLGLVFTF